MESLIHKIGELNAYEIDSVFEAAWKRKRELHPEYEMVYIALPKENNQERKNKVDWIMNYLNKEQESR